MHENRMNWKKRLGVWARMALLALTAALLLWLIFTCAAEGLKLVHARRQQDVREMLPLTPADAVSEPAAEAPASEFVEDAQMVHKGHNIPEQIPAQPAHKPAVELGDEHAPLAQACAQYLVGRAL